MKRTIILFLAACLVFSACAPVQPDTGSENTGTVHGGTEPGSATEPTTETAPVTQPATEPVVATEGAIEALTSMVADAALIEADVMNGIAKIDIISPSLDGCSMRVVMYDIANGTVLSDTQFAESAWETGITQAGFYCVDLNSRALYLYHSDGSIKYEKVFDGSGPWLLAAVSPDEKHLLYTAGGLHIFDIENHRDTAVPSVSSFRESLGWYGGRLYLLGIDMDLFAVDPATGSAVSILNGDYLNRFSPYYSIGTTDYNFLVEDGSDILYVPYTSVDEIVAGIGESGFSTSVLNDDGQSTVFTYDLKNALVYTNVIGGTVQSVCYVDEERLLVIAGNISDGKHIIYLCRLDRENAEPLEAGTEDLPQSLIPGESTPETTPGGDAIIIENVPVIWQFPDYPTGCESVSAIMVLRYAGETIGIDEFIDEYLPKSSNFYMDGGLNYGPSPYEYFIGNPRSSASYGCMAPVIEAALTDYFGSSERIINTTGMGLSELCTRYIDNGVPVMVWATINMLETRPNNTWYLPSGTRFAWPGNEHCMVLVGYDDEYYYFNDPYAGAMVRYDKTKAESRYAELGFQSLVIV